MIVLSFHTVLAHEINYVYEQFFVVEWFSLRRCCADFAGVGEVGWVGCTRRVFGSPRHAAWLPV